MAWEHVLVILMAILFSTLWQISESKSEMRHFESKIRSWKSDIDKEMRDFHGRLCAIEERRGK